MIISGLRKFSLIDYPGKTCAILFTRGCNFRCPYCHNPELVWSEQYAPEIPLPGALKFLEGRRGQLDAVTITGGEPTLHPDLPDLMMRLKEMGFALKLDTNGSHPEMLRVLIAEQLLDYVAMDIKAPLADYHRITGQVISATVLRESIQLVFESNKDYEFRTTVDRMLLTENDLLMIGQEIQGANKFYLQKLNSYNSKNPKLTGNADDEKWLREIAHKLCNYVKFCIAR
ncbi:TPA: anaerobic ribonucleoside-triphosphate reductase activating protein [candidate division WOR-3 bacterium]|nr:anaerobic ribonucleoside-triphosphate reductase activating protein [candidate division WOR-3 bacterium]